MLLLYYEKFYLSSDFVIKHEINLMINLKYTYYINLQNDNLHKTLQKREKML